MEKYPEWKQAVDDFLSEFNYGDVVTHEWLTTAFDLPVKNGMTYDEYKERDLRLLNAMNNFRETLLKDHKRYLVSVPGKGYLVVMPDQQTEVVWEAGQKRIFKALKKTKDGLVNINKALLSADEYKKNMVKRSKLAALAGVTRNEIEV